MLDAIAIAMKDGLLTVETINTYSEDITLKALNYDLIKLDKQVKGETNN